MPTIDAKWQLNRNVEFTTLRTALLVFSIAFCMLTWHVATRSFAERAYFLPPIAVIYLLFCAIGVKKYFQTSLKERAIFLQDRTLSIPRLFFKSYLVKLDEIKSAEKCTNSSGSLAILIGRRNKYPILLERRRFKSEDEFEKFSYFLNEIALANQPKQSNPEIKIATRAESIKDSDIRAIVVLSITFAALYVITAGREFEALKQTAITYGALTKTTLSVTEFYRIASSFFLHANPFHLLLNILFLAVTGRFIGAVLRQTQLINVIFYSAATGALLSLTLSPHNAVTGASGGILGLFGAYHCVCTRYHEYLPGSVSVPTWAIWLGIIVQVLVDLTNFSTDVFSHVGGFLFGYLYMHVTFRRSQINKVAQVVWSEFFLSIAITSAYILGLIYFLYLYFDLA